MTSDAVEVVVVGSLNVDLSLQVERFPEPGETVIGGELVRGGGGKGANQAVAVARLGRRVAMVGAVGNDDAGRFMNSELAEAGIDLAHLRVVDEAPTGLAVIEVDAAGENRIVVVSGANATVGRDQNHFDRWDSLVAQVRDTAVILAQLEIPIASVLDLARLPRSGRLVLNPAPAPSSSDADLAELLERVDVVVPNRGELATLAGQPAAVSTAEVVDQVRMIGSRIDAAIVTLGAAGAVVVEGIGTKNERVDEVPALLVDAVDTTAAGDAFCGALADAMCQQASYVDATRWATRVAAVTVTRRGAQASLPWRAEAEDLSESS